MGKTFSFWWTCVKRAAHGSSAFANDWQWLLGFPVLAANLYYEEKARADALHQNVDDLESKARDREQERLAHLERMAAQEAHTAAIKEQSALLREQNSPLHRAIRDQQEQQIKTALDPEFRKQGWFNALRREYIASHDGISPALLAGTELPPADWMNRRLEELGKPWRMPTDKKK